MKLKSISLLLISAIYMLVVACGSSQPQPDIDATVEAKAENRLAVEATAQAASTLTPTNTPAPPKLYDAPPRMTIQPDKKYTATIELEKGGAIEIELFASKAPMTVNNFVFLSQQGYYDGVTFHRVIPGFMAQSGDPTATGSGTPGYQFDNEFHPDLRHSSPGILSMANAGTRGGRGTNGSQFFITYVPTLRLDGLNPDGSPKNCSAPGTSCHSVFGRVTGGMDVLNGISARNPSTARTPGDAIKTILIRGPF